VREDGGRADGSRFRMAEQEGLLNRTPQQNQQAPRLKVGDQEKIKQHPRESVVLGAGRREKWFGSLEARWLVIDSAEG
jgi:hypothetical protein